MIGRGRGGKAADHAMFVGGCQPRVLALPLPFLLRFLQTRERRTSEKHMIIRINPPTALSILPGDILSRAETVDTIPSIPT
jgi:hypothetical protein